MSVKHSAKPAHRLAPRPTPVNVVVREPAGLLHAQSQNYRRQHGMFVGDDGADRVECKNRPEGQHLLQDAAFEEALLLELHPELLEGAVSVKFDLLGELELVRGRGSALWQLGETIGGNGGPVGAVAMERIEHPSGIAPVKPLNPTSTAGVSQRPSTAVVPFPIDAQACL
eukprot:45861-Pyramimonas_sp.AAC.1